jgi:hypothetical protein
MDTPEEIKKELRALGLGRSWLASASGYSMSTIHHALSQVGHEKSRQRIAIVIRAEKQRREVQAMAKAADAIIRAGENSTTTNL